MLERQFLDPMQSYTSTAGSWAPYYASGGGWMLLNTTSALNDEVSMTVGLAAGTYKLDVEYMHDSECCEGTFYLDGAEIGKINQYEAAVENKVGYVHTFTDIVVAEAGKHTLAVKVTAKGAASAEYFVIGYMSFHE